MSDAARGGALARVALYAAVVVGVANLVAEVLLFGTFIAPMLAEGEPVAPWQWGIVYLPVLAAALWVMRRVSRFSEAIACGLASGIVAQLEKWALAVIGAAGHEAALAAVAPARFWGLHFGRMTLGFVALFVLLLAAQRLVLRRARPA